MIGGTVPRMNKTPVIRAFALESIMLFTPFPVWLRAFHYLNGNQGEAQIPHASYQTMQHRLVFDPSRQDASAAG
ncbi:MAG TPA: hypothetical protein VMV44_13670, partial [Rectinemataceae bacterium]|nr:hypothetical protein [Rectinemataceae bacterium]